MRTTNENREVGLTYMQARYYDPALRRFISADTIVPDPGASIGYNRFAYANQNPISFFDPSGNFTVDAIEQHISDLCGGLDNCIDEMLAAWQENTEWWEMLLAAQAGDILYGTYDYWGGSPEGSFFFGFLGQGHEELSGVQLMSTTGSRGHLLEGKGLSTLFNGSFSLPDGFIGHRIVRMVWNGVVNNTSQAKPVYIRDSTASFLVARAERQDVERRLNNIHGKNVSSQEIAVALITNLGLELAVALITNLGLELAEAGICAASRVMGCSLAYAGTTGLMDGVLGVNPPYSYAIRSGPFEFHYEYPPFQPNLISGTYVRPRHLIDKSD